MQAWITETFGFCFFLLDPYNVYNVSPVEGASSICSGQVREHPALLESESGHRATATSKSFIFTIKMWLLAALALQLKYKDQEQFSHLFLPFTFDWQMKGVLKAWKQN